MITQEKRLPLFATVEWRCQRHETQRNSPSNPQNGKRAAGFSARRPAPRIVKRGHQWNAIISLALEHGKVCSFMEDGRFEAMWAGAQAASAAMEPPRWFAPCSTSPLPLEGDKILVFDFACVWQESPTPQSYRPLSDGPPLRWLTRFLTNSRRKASSR